MFRKLKSFFTGSLRRQLIIGVALVHAVMMALFVWDLTSRQKELLLERQTDQALALAHSVATSASGWVAARDYYGLQEIVTAQSRYPELLFAMILDRGGKVLAHTQTQRIGEYVTDLPVIIDTQVLLKTPSLVDVMGPIELAYEHIGWVRVGLGQEAMASRLAAITRDGIIYTIVAILIGSLLAWFLGMHLTRKLYAIRAAAHAVESGDSESRVSLSGDDEIVEVAHAFNQMLDSLHASQTELLEAHERIFLATDSAQIGIWDYDLVGMTGCTACTGFRLKHLRMPTRHGSIACTRMTWKKPATSCGNQSTKRNPTMPSIVLLNRMVIFTGLLPMVHLWLTMMARPSD